MCSGKVEEAVKDLIGRLRHTAMLPIILPSDSEGMVKSKSGLLAAPNHLNYM